MDGVLQVEMRKKTGLFFQGRRLVQQVVHLAHDMQVTVAERHRTRSWLDKQESGGGSQNGGPPSPSWRLDSYPKFRDEIHVCRD